MVAVNITAANVIVKSPYCGKFVRQKVTAALAMFYLLKSLAASASALYVQCGLNLLPHFFGPALFPLVTWLWPPNRSACLKFNPFPSSHGVINTRFAKHTFCWKYSNFSHQLKVIFELNHAQVFGTSVFIAFLSFSCSFKLQFVWICFQIVGHCCRIS